MSDESTSKDVREATDAMRIAAQIRWADPKLSWAEIAERVGFSERQVYRWRHSEQWEIAFREAGVEYIEKLAPAAVSALVRAWAKGNPSGALEVLRSYGFLNPPKLTITHNVHAIDEELQRLLNEVIGEHSDENVAPASD